MEIFYLVLPILSMLAAQRERHDFRNPYDKKVKPIRVKNFYTAMEKIKAAYAFAEATEGKH